MKKIILFNFLITTIWIPYSMQRWLEMPYAEGVLEDVLIFGTFFMGTALAFSNVLLLLSQKWTKYKRQYLKLTMIFLAGLFVFPIYSGLVVGYEGQAIWMDIVVLGCLYMNLSLSNKEYQLLIHQ
ncbi:hypothetical protein [Aureispira anguillae]|uniref:Uncharacterized protein n=1 Tax=Aureispira anguillae TaxID=2864201 RepID=A0A916DUZ2_9BACT|nr:hypothetical protein [Aureispira anguillae]BDS14589.1 hypothetical protein AsAng_0053700 [Aureispira anguillae]